MLYFLFLLQNLSHSLQLCRTLIVTSLGKKLSIQESRANVADTDEVVEEKAVDPLLKRYVKVAEAAADKMEKRYNYYSGPVFAKIYSHYFNDMEVIARQGTAPDNSELYEDLEMMNDSRLQLFYQNKKAAFEK